MTPQELKRLNEELVELLRAKYPERITDPTARPEGALPVDLLLFDYPVPPPQGGAA